MIKKYKRALRLFVAQHYSYRYYKKRLGTSWECTLRCKKLPRLKYNYMICELRSLRKKYRQMYKNNIGRSK